MVKLKLVALGISLVLGVATAVMTVLFSARAMHWFGTLSAGDQKVWLYSFMLLSVVLGVLHGWRLWRKAKARRAAQP